LALEGGQHNRFIIRADAAFSGPRLPLKRTVAGLTAPALKTAMWGRTGTDGAGEH
jgi:hypothetical protein